MGFFQKIRDLYKEETPSTKAPLAEVVDEAHEIVEEKKEEPKKEVKKTTKKASTKKTTAKKTAQKKEVKEEVKEEKKCILVGFDEKAWKEKHISAKKK